VRSRKPSLRPLRRRTALLLLLGGMALAVTAALPLLPFTTALVEKLDAIPCASRCWSCSGPWRSASPSLACGESWLHCGVSRSLLLFAVLYGAIQL